MLYGPLSSLVQDNTISSEHCYMAEDPHLPKVVTALAITCKINRSNMPSRTELYYFQDCMINLL